MKKSASVSLTDWLNFLEGGEKGKKVRFLFNKVKNHKG